MFSIVDSASVISHRTTVPETELDSWIRTEYQRAVGNKKVRVQEEKTWLKRTAQKVIRFKHTGN